MDGALCFQGFPKGIIMTDIIAAVDQVIRGRKTTKLLATSPLDTTTDHAMVESLVAAAGWAPFHRGVAPSHLENASLTAIMPWRFYLIDAANCRVLREDVLARGITDNVPKMLATCVATVLVTWLPNPRRAPAEGADVVTPAVGELFEGTEQNMEHIAAASAAVQNLLLGATARGLHSFWSSGGVMRRADTFAMLGIPADEILLGAVYLFPSDTSGAEVVTTKLGEKRGEPSGWSRWVTVPVPA